MLRSLRIGRAFGIDIYLHWTFWILPLIFIFQTKAFTLATAGLALAFIALMVTCIVLHEFGHILTARAFGIGTKDVILTPIGGMARMERMSEKPTEEILIALAGPAVNVIVAFLLCLFAIPFLEPIMADLQETTDGTISTGWELLVALIGSNLVMAGFNMLPAFPMDGGRIFRGILASFMERVPATTIAVWIGTAVIGMVGLLFTLTGSLLAIPLAMFIAFVGHVELAMVKRQAELRRREEYERLRDEADAADLADDVILPGAPPEPDFSGYTWNARANAWIEWRAGNPVRACRMRAG